LTGAIEKTCNLQPATCNQTKTTGDPTPNPANAEMRKNFDLPVNRP